MKFTMELKNASRGDATGTLRNVFLVPERGDKKLHQTDKIVLSELGEAAAAAFLKNPGDGSPVDPGTLFEVTINRVK